MACCSGPNSSRSRTTSPFLSSVRCPSMIRCASSASLAWTAMRTSVRPSTDIGKTECNTSDETTDMTPCVSSSPRTICASMSECVRKMTTRSVTQPHLPYLPHLPGRSLLGNLRELRAGQRDGDCRVVDLQQDHRHVVVLRGVADERGDLAQHALAELF